MKLLIIGGSGHVSGTLAKCAVAQGHQTWTLTRGARPLPPGVNPLVADRHDTAAVRQALLAAGTESWDMAVDCICYDTPDILQDLELLRGRTQRLVLISTDFVYDPARRRFPQSEAGAAHVPEAAAQVQAYGWKKRLCEAFLERQAGGLEWTVLRPCHIYGPSSKLGCLPLHGRDPELPRRLAAGEALKLVGGGHFLQQPLLAGDLAETILSVHGNAAAANRIFNVAGPDIVESRQYYQIIADLLRVPLRLEEVPVRDYLAAHPEAAPFLCHRIYDLAALRGAGLRIPATPLAAGLEKHVREMPK